MVRNRATSLNPLFKIDVTAVSYIMATLLPTLVIVVMFVFPYYWRSNGHGVGVDLPPVNHPSKKLLANRDDAIVVAIFRDGTMYIENERISVDRLPEKISERVKHGGGAKGLHQSRRACEVRTGPLRVAGCSIGGIGASRLPHGAT